MVRSLSFCKRFAIRKRQLDFDGKNLWAKHGVAVRSPAGVWITAHNSYVSFLREIGVIGLLLVCTFTLAVLFRTMSHELFPWGMAIIGLLMISDTETFMYGSHCVLFLGAAGGIACGARPIPNDTSVTQGSPLPEELKSEM